MKSTTIGILTSGGDCGGLNAVIKGAARMAASKGVTTLAIPNGYAGLYNLVDIDNLTPLTASRLDRFSISRAGSEAGHSRVKISRIKNEAKYDRIKEGLAKFGISGLVISGGDDTGSVVRDLDAQGIKCIHAPKTMDLDLMPYSVGGDSTINRIARFLSDIKTTGQTHNRIIVMEVFGRYAGHSAFRGGIAGEADAILIPEVPVDFGILYEHMKNLYMRRMRESDVKASTYLIVVAEGLKDASGSELYDESAGVDTFGHKKLAGAGKYVAQELIKRLEADEAMRKFWRDEGMFVDGLSELPEVRTVSPGHLVRSGETSAYDANFGMEAGAGAVSLLLAGKSGLTVTGIIDGRIGFMSLEDSIKQRQVSQESVSLYEQLGYCFGKQEQAFNPEFEAVSGRIQRIY